MGSSEIFCEGTRRCIDLFSGKPLGFFGCNHVADSQGWKYEKSKIIRTSARGIPSCIDGEGIAAGEAVNLTPCTSWPLHGRAAQPWFCPWLLARGRYDVCRLVTIAPHSSPMVLFS